MTTWALGDFARLENAKTHDLYFAVARKPTLDTHADVRREVHYLFLFLVCHNFIAVELRL